MVSIQSTHSDMPAGCRRHAHQFMRCRILKNLLTVIHFFAWIQESAANIEFCLGRPGVGFFAIAMAGGWKKIMVILFYEFFLARVKVIHFKRPTVRLMLHGIGATAVEVTKQLRECIPIVPA